MAFHSPCSLDNPQICYTLWSKFHLAICRQMLLVISKSKTLPSSFRPIFSKIFLTIASYTILYGLTPLLCILWHRALSTEPSVILPLWIRISHIPASKNVLLRMYMYIISMWNIPIIKTMFPNFCFSFRFLLIAFK